MDLKALGYFISTVSVAFLGIVAWPRPGEPQWQAWAVAIGMATSVLGMFVRYLSHRKDRHEIHRAEAKADGNRHAGKAHEISSTNVKRARPRAANRL